MANNKATEKAQEVAPPMAAPVAEQSQAPMATGEFEWRCLTCGKTAPPTEKREPPIIEKGDFPTGKWDSSIGNP